MYPEEIVIPMKEELTDNGFSELLSASEVEAQLSKEGTTLVMINSVCGCSAGTARPGVLLAVANAKQKPTYLATSFAGFDVEAINTLRQHLAPYPPSSPAIALFKNGQRTLPQSAANNLQQRRAGDFFLQKTARPKCL